MMDEEGFGINKDLLFLLAKRRKLVNLRDTIKCEEKKDDVGNDNMVSNKPDTPLSSTTEISITPPPFSPLTPRMYGKNDQESKSYVPYTASPLTFVHSTTSPMFNHPSGCSSDTPLPHGDVSAVNSTQLITSPISCLSRKNETVVNIPRASLSPVISLEPNSLFIPCEPPEIQTNVNNEERNSSPLPCMSPETQKLFDVLNEQDVLENDSPNYIENSDDSVADPTFQVSTVNETETDCESNGSGDDDNTKASNNIRNAHIESFVIISENDSNKTMNSSIKNKDKDIRHEPLMDDETNILTFQKTIPDKFSPVIEVQEIGNISPEEQSLEISNEEIIGNNDQVLITSTPNTGRPKKGRKRKHPESNSERKFKKFNNLPYTTVRAHKKMEAKVFKDYQCKCLKKCASAISFEDRKQIFETYVTLGSYNAQLMYIKSCVTEEPKKRSYTMTSVPVSKKKPKQFHRTYKLNDIKVCRDMFLHTLQISTQKVTIALYKIRHNEINDRRGIKDKSWNKLSEQNLNFIMEVISNLPKYKSHYRRENNNEVEYLEPGMTLPKLYDVYKKLFAEKFGTELKCASFETLKKIFLTNFNLKCKPLKKDTCNKCDSFAVKLQNTSGPEKIKIEADKLSHLEKAEKMRKQMNCDFETARNTRNIECLSYDLEKTLPLPRIPTNVIFYKRQLWLYNSGIHSASDDVGHCYVWVEGEAGRGAQEVGSVLVKYIENKLPSHIEHLILWSDCCGGQNRNIKIVLMLKVILDSHSTLKTITFRYLESGHSFLPNDTDFSKIETALKNHQRVYTADEYIEIMKTARKKKPFQVNRMDKNDFFSTEDIEKNIVNRKKFKDKSKVNWLHAKEIKIEKAKLYSIFMRTSLDEDFKELQIEKKIKGEITTINKSDLKQLWPNGKEIAPAKLADLRSIYTFIPADCLGFYKTLKASDEAIDDVDGFGKELDFHLENE